MRSHSNYFEVLLYLQFLSLLILLLGFLSYLIVVANHIVLDAHLTLLEAIVAFTVVMLIKLLLSVRPQPQR